MQWKGEGGGEEDRTEDVESELVLLTAQIPNLKVDILISHRLHVESDRYR